MTLPSEPFLIVDVTAWREGSPEPMGRTGKMWLLDPAGEGVADRWLFKPVGWQRHGGVPTFRLGSDWSERIASGVAEVVGIPAARVELAVRDGEPGMISRLVHPADLVHGDELLDTRRHADPSGRMESDGATQYTLDAVLDVLARFAVGPPPGVGDAGIGAGGWFAGYLVFDALIGNTDRHQQNWGILAEVGQPLRLAPLYDHASSLGFQTGEAFHREALETRDRNRRVEAYAARARGRAFAGKPNLVQLAVDACVGTSTVAFWRNRLASVPAADLDAVVERVPPARLSQGSRRFVSELLAENLRRLTDALTDL